MSGPTSRPGAPSLGRPPPPAHPGACQNRSSSPVRVEVVAAVTKGVQDLMVEVARVRDAFYSAIYSASSLGAAMALTAPDCALVNVPAGSGATGGDGLRRYPADDVLPHPPPDPTL